MGQVNLASNLLDRIKRAEKRISDVAKQAGLASATIAAGGLTLLNNAFFKMVGPTDNELVYIGPDGLGNQVVRFRDGAGNIIFGSITSSTGGQRVAINPNPAGAARIEFYDDVSSTTDRVSLSMAGASFVQQREKPSDSTITGGKVSFYNGNTVFGHQIAATGTDAYLQFLDDERIFMRGKWATQQNLSGNSALHVGTGNVGAGPITLVASYGATMAGNMRPIVTRQGNLADTYWAVTAASSTGFEVTSSGGSSNQFHYWIFRTS
ncbi:hypothetical protein [Amycolatopsis kentuckyensis]|uniref:hypothetical protein n=1 Tax=Amycolatopsis kentuckyensis TaxID=218823 RepID=UPI000A3AE473|nr:hypothetical protein [Amycolatopsis kentuckyensis]